MADDKNLATLKVTVTADKSPLKKALDSAKKDTEKSTSQIQRISENQENNVLCFSKGNGKRFSGEIRDKGSNAGVWQGSLREGKLRLKGQGDCFGWILLEKQKKLEALGVKEQSRELWKSFAI